MQTTEPTFNFALQFWNYKEHHYDEAACNTQNGGLSFTMGCDEMLSTARKPWACAWKKEGGPEVLGRGVWGGGCQYCIPKISLFVLVGLTYEYPLRKVAHTTSGSTFAGDVTSNFLGGAIGNWLKKANFSGAKKKTDQNFISAHQTFRNFF